MWYLLISRQREILLTPYERTTGGTFACSAPTYEVQFQQEGKNNLSAPLLLIDIGILSLESLDKLFWYSVPLLLLCVFGVLKTGRNTTTPTTHCIEREARNDERGIKTRGPVDNTDMQHLMALLLLVVESVLFIHRVLQVVEVSHQTVAEFQPYGFQKRFPSNIKPVNHTWAPCPSELQNNALQTR
jgi:hypothetical protein